MSSKAISALLWDYLNLMAKQGGSLIIGMILARLLTPADFGLVGLMGIFNALAGAFIQMGFYSALIREDQENKKLFSSVFWLNLISAMVMTLIFFVSAPAFAHFFNQPQLEGIIRITSFNFIGSAICLVHIVHLTKNMNFKKQSQAQIISLVCSGSLAIVLAYYGFGVWSIVYQSVFATFLNAAVIWRSSKWRPLFHFRLSDLSKVWKFSVYMFASGMINTVTEKLDTLLIGKFLTPVTLGLYTRAQSLNLLTIKFSSESIGKVSYPMLVKTQSQEELIELNKKILHVICFVLFPILALFNLNAHFIITTLFSYKWVDSVPYLKVLIIAGFAHPVNSQILSVIKTTGKSKLFLIAEILKVSSYFSILIFCFWMGGVNWMVWGIVCSSVISTFINIYFANLAMKVKSYYQTSIIASYLLPVLLLGIIGEYICNDHPLQTMSYSAILVTAYILYNHLRQSAGYQIILSKLFPKS